MRTSAPKPRRRKARPEPVDHRRELRIIFGPPKRDPRRALGRTMAEVIEQERRR